MATLENHLLNRYEKWLRVKLFQVAGPGQVDSADASFIADILWVIQIQIEDLLLRNSVYLI